MPASLLAAERDGANAANGALPSTISLSPKALRPPKATQASRVAAIFGHAQQSANKASRHRLSPYSAPPPSSPSKPKSNDNDVAAISISRLISIFPANSEMSMVRAVETLVNPTTNNNLLASYLISSSTWLKRSLIQAPKTVWKHFTLPTPLGP